jgi:EAL domain-containing protein (putative c-di-GMP-specific phosphodiesterase class I)
MLVRAVDDKPSDTLVVVSGEGFWTGSSTLPHLHHFFSRARGTRHLVRDATNDASRLGASPNLRRAVELRAWQPVTAGQGHLRRSGAMIPSMRFFSSAQHRVLSAIGAFGLLAALVTGVTWVNIANQDRELGDEYATAGELQADTFELAANIRDQESAVDAFVLAADGPALTRFLDASAHGRELAGTMRETAANLPNVLAALARLTDAMDTWHQTVAEPAIAAVQAGRRDQLAVQGAALAREQTGTYERIDELVATEIAYSALLDVANEAVIAARSRALVVGVGSTIGAGLISLWIFQLHSLSEMRESVRRRGAWSAKRLAIVASLRTLRPQPTADATAQMICNALIELPGIHVASVFECIADGIRAVAMAGDPGFPLQPGDDLRESEGGVRALLGRTAIAPWAQPWVLPSAPTAYQLRLAQLGIKSRAFAAIQSGEEMIGVIAVGTTDEDHARHLFEDLPAIAEFASVADAILAPALVTRRDRARARVRIESLIAEWAFRPVYQPVVELRTGLTVGFEALTRFSDRSRPDEVFAAARACGLGAEFELATLRASLAEARRLPPDAWISVNVSPSVLSDADLLRPVLAGGTRAVVLEVTEHEAIDDYRAVRLAVEGLGSRVRLAVDDAGAGVANFNHLVELRPAFVKVDMGLVRGVDTDVGRQAVVVGLVHFALTAGCQVIAEGIESDGERAMLVDLGVALGQGYLLGRPASVDAWIPPPMEGDDVNGPSPDRLRPSVFLTPAALA